MYLLALLGSRSTGAMTGAEFRVDNCRAVQQRDREPGGGIWCSANPLTGGCNIAYPGLSDRHERHTCSVTR